MRAQTGGVTEPSESAAPPPRWKRLLRAGIPWVVALGAMGWVFSSIPIDQAAAAIGQAPLAAFLAVGCAFSLSLWFADTLALFASFGASLPDSNVPYRGLLWVRGASYLLALISYGAGQGGIVYFAHRRHRVSLAGAASAVLLASGCFVLIIGIVVGAGAALGAIPESKTLTLAAYATAAILPSYLLVILWRPGFLANRRLLTPLFTAGIAGTLRVCGARAIHLVCLIAGHWAALSLFGIEVPLASALARLPVLFFIASLPISPSGLGTTQAAAIALFASYAPGADEGARAAAVVAYSLSLQVVGSLVTLSIGLVSLRQAGRDGVAPAPIDESRPPS